MIKTFIFVLFLNFSLILGVSRNIAYSEFKFHVGVLRSTDGVMCSGVVLCSRYVITTLRCVGDLIEPDPESVLLPRDVEVLAGSRNRSNAYKHQVVDIYIPIHVKVFGDKIAVLKLKEELSPFMRIGRIKPVSGNIFPVTSYQVLGWGRGAGSITSHADIGSLLDKVSCYQKISIYSDNVICLDNVFSSDLGSPVFDTQNNLVALGVATVTNLPTVAFIPTHQYSEWINSFCADEPF